MYPFGLSEQLGRVVFGEEKVVEGSCHSIAYQHYLLRTVFSTYSIRSHSANFLYSTDKSAILSLTLISAKSFERPSNGVSAIHHK